MFSEFNWMQLIAESPALITLILFSVVTLGVVIERALYFHARRGNPDDVAREVTARLHRGDVKEALWSCQHTTHPIGPVLQVVVGAPVDDPEAIDEQIYVSVSQQRLLLERNLNVLGTMAGAAPLVGLLGTVWGIMRAFHDMALVGSAAPSVVAAGIAEALVTTAVGLLVAVPALLLYNHFSRRTNVMLTMAENHARSIRHWMRPRDDSRGNRQRPMADVREAAPHSVRSKPEPVSIG